MQTFQSIRDWQGMRRQLPVQESIGFVPTMGALHEGHFSLVEHSTAECDITVVSIFVNPTQFNDPGDLEHYPRDLDSDARELERRDVDFLILPDFDQIYPDNYRYRVTESSFSRELCGASRPGHFDGVLTVVMKLLNLVRPDRAYFGEKDFQQYLLVKDMVDAFFMDAAIVPCAIVRDPDGIALSSRNRLLSPAGKKLAQRFARILREGASASAVREQLEASDGIEVDYVVDRDGRRFGAVHVEGVRLIDNVAL